MHPKVSQFSLHPESGRRTFGPKDSSRSSALSRSALRHEVVVPVTSRAGIRAEVDACLDAIEEAYHSRKAGGQSTMAKSSVQENAVHRIETAIVKDYVETVYRDYGLRNRFGQLSSNVVHHSPQIDSFAARKNVLKDVGVQVKVERRAQSARTMNSPPSPRKYISITQESKVSGRQGSHSILRKAEFTADSAQGSPPRVSQSKAIKSTKGDSSFQKIRDDFRFCVNCQRPVLAANSDFHERYDCQGFDRLYSLGLEELAKVMEGKTQNARNVLKTQLDELKQRRNDGRTKGETILLGSIQLMEQLAKNPQSSPKQIEQQFIAAGLLRQAQNNLYSKSLQQAQKVASFQEITTNLKKEADKLKLKLNGMKTQQMRPITLIRSSFNPPVQVGVLPLHPHLHRYVRKRL